LGKYIEVYTTRKFEEMCDLGFNFLYEDAGVYYFENNEDLSKKVKFSKSKKFNEDNIVESNSLKF
jgi:hypothetical protein